MFLSFLSKYFFIILQLYDELKKIKPDFLTKIVSVDGNVEELNSGLSEKDRNMLLEEVRGFVIKNKTISFFFYVTIIILY